MPIRFKTYGGGWTAPVSEGKLRLKWGGSSWVVPGLVHRKNGDVGGGSWYDTGYRGIPYTPSTPWVHDWTSWGYSYITVAWSAAIGGATPSSYDALQMDAAGNWLSTEFGGTDTYATFPTIADGRYIFLVRASTAGGQSGWSGQLRVQMGHAALPNYGYKYTIDPWFQQVTGSWGKDNPAYMVVPENVQITAFHYNLSAPQGNMISPASNRWLHHVFSGTAQPDVLTLSSPVSYVESLPPIPGHATTYNFRYGNWGRNLLWGIVPRGSGWGSYGTPSGNYYLLNGSFGIEGTKEYVRFYEGEQTAAVPNSYW